MQINALHYLTLPKLHLTTSTEDSERLNMTGSALRVVNVSIIVRQENTLELMRRVRGSVPVASSQLTQRFCTETSCPVTSVI